MSLIANALKAAQQAKDKQAGTGTAQQRRVRSVVGDATARGLSAPRSRTDRRLFSPLLISLLAVLGAVVIGGIAWKTGFGRADAPQPVAQRAPEQSQPFAPIIEAGADPTADGVYADATILPDDAAAFETEYEAPRREASARTERGMDRQPISPSPQPGTFVPIPAGSTAPLAVETAERPGAGNFRLSVDVPAADITDLLRRAMRSYAAGDYPDATDLYLRAIAAGGASAEVYNNLGVSYRAAGDLARARDAYRSALELDPRNAVSWSNLGVIMDGLGDKDQATAAYQRALEYDPSNAPAKVNLARHYHASKLLADARRLFEEALRFDPLLAEAHYGLARVLEDQGDQAGAIRHYQNFLSTHADRFPREAAGVRRRLQELTGRTS